MKKFDVTGFNKPFRVPVVGRLLLIAVLVLFPVLGPAAAVWANRKNLMEEWLEIAQACFLPWKNRRE